MYSYRCILFSELCILRAHGPSALYNV